MDTAWRQSAAAGAELAILGGTPVRDAPLAPRVHVVDHIRSDILDLIQSGAFAGWRGGPAVRAFENAFAQLHGPAHHSVAVNSGTSALHLACVALGLGPGDEVIMPCAAYVSAASAVVQVGGVPVVCDVDPRTMTMDVEDAARRITGRTRALMPVHFWGCPSDMGAIMALARQHDLRVIEDCGQSHGARVEGRLGGSFGDAACYSFAPRKHISTGQGGAVVTADPELAERVRDLCNKGKGEGWLDYRELGFSYAMAEFEGLLGLNGLEQLDAEVARRRAAADVYRSELEGTGLRTWGDPPWGRHVYFKMPLALPPSHADELQWVVDAIHAENVSCRPTHPPLSSIAWLRQYAADHGRGWSAQDQPVAYSLLPLIFEVETGPGMTEDDVVESARTVRKVVAALADRPGRHG